MKLTCLGELSFGLDARDVEFWDDDTLVLTTPSADVWRVVVLPTARKPELLLTGKQVTKPVAQALGRPDFEPWAFLGLALSTQAKVAVVNPYDLVLVACPLDGGNERLLCIYCGYYDAHMAFSSDGSRFSAYDDGILLVFDTDTWQGLQYERTDISVWHPREPMLLHKYDGQLGWTDFRDIVHPVFRPLGFLIPWPNIVVDATGNQCVTASAHCDRLEWWQLDPFRLVDSRSVEGEVQRLRSNNESRFMVVESNGGVQIWDFEKRTPVSEVIEGASKVKFSPLGRRFVTQCRESNSPFILWNISE